MYVAFCLSYLPTVYEDGKVCISILHPPGEDRYNEQETAEERWRPIIGVEAIIISVISMLSDPNDTSPANIDAAVRSNSWTKELFQLGSLKKHSKSVSHYEFLMNFFLRTTGHVAQ